MRLTREQEEQIITLENGLTILAAALRQMRREYADNQGVHAAVAERLHLLRQAMQEVEAMLLAPTD